MATEQASYPIEMDLQGNIVVTAPRGVHYQLAWAYSRAHRGSVSGFEHNDIVTVNAQHGMTPVYFIAAD